MEEKVLVKSKQYDVKKLFQIMVIVGVVISVLGFIGMFNGYMNDFDYSYEQYTEHQDKGSCYSWRYTYSDKCYHCSVVENESKVSYALSETFRFWMVVSIILPGLALALIGALIYFWLRSYELTVTDKRIYGKVAFGKRVDLPVDSVSATAIISLLKGVSVSTSSGKISFLAIKNADEIYNEINSLLIARQSEKKTVNVEKVPKSDEADQLKKYKDLLDSGVITQKEFDAKKKQLLGL